MRGSGFPFGGLGLPEVVSVVLVLALTCWSVFWKAIALWKAARRDQLAWYVILAILNTAGLLEIVYIFAIAPRRPDLVSESQAPA
jgi:hypothetical protein